MKEKCRLTVRSVSSETRQKLTALKQYTRLPMGALLDDAISELWAMYLKDNHELPDLHYIDEMEEAQ